MMGYSSVSRSTPYVRACTNHRSPLTLALGKAEGDGVEHHGHVTVITVAPEYRRLGLARKMNLLELAPDDVYKGFFVDLYERYTNVLAIDIYEGFGYNVYRRVELYYGSLGLGMAAKDEDASGKHLSTFWGFPVLIASRQICDDHYLGICIDGL